MLIQKIKLIKITFVIMLFIICLFVNSCSANPSGGPGGGSSLNILADHTAVQNFDNIPDEWITEAKKLIVHYGHTSHGSQVLTGLVILNLIDSTKYAFNIRDEDNAQIDITVPMPPEDRIPVQIPSGGDSTLRITREGAWYIGYWGTEEGLVGTKNVLNYDGGLFDVSGWLWCGELAADGDQIVYDYLDAMEDLEATFPDMHFFYSTQHVEPTSSNVKRHNDMIRDYCREHRKILYDFADIESWDLDGNYYPDATQDCGWCQTWCDNPSHSTDLECIYFDLLPENSDICCGGAGCGNMFGCESMCAHSHGINCLIKGKAFWWMMARIAGWDGK